MVIHSQRLRSSSGGDPVQCPICGANHASCGGPTNIVPVDILESEETVAKGDLVYVETRPGQGFKTTKKKADAYVKANKSAKIVKAKAETSGAQTANDAGDTGKKDKK